MSCDSRGPKFRDMQRGMLQINNQECLLVGNNAPFFPRSISEIINDHCDLYYKCWTEVPFENEADVRKPCEGTTFIAYV
jgi:hypothetical protein